MQDSDILRQLRHCPEKGMRTLMERYTGLLYTVVRGRLPGDTFSSADVEDCVSDAFIEFYLGLDRYDPERGSIQAWLCVIARNNALDLARKRLQVRTAELNEDTAEDGGTALESRMEEQEMRRAVLDEVRQLEQPDREIILRKFYLGESSRQIAQRLNLTVSNVDTRTSRAVGKLREKLKQWRE